MEKVELEGTEEEKAQGFREAMEKLAQARAEHEARFRNPEFPEEISGIEPSGLVDLREAGTPVVVRGCGEDQKSYLGILLGRLPLELFSLVERQTGKLHQFPRLNPCMYVPGLKKVVWGCESWWRPATKEDLEHLSPITDEAIQNSPVVQILNSMLEQDDQQGND